MENMKDNSILRRIANNHQIKFTIEPLSYDPIGGVKITLIKENEEGPKSYISRIILRYDIDALVKPDETFIMILNDTLDQAEEEDA